jgi:hypothetical protein
MERNERAEQLIKRVLIDRNNGFPRLNILAAIVPNPKPATIKTGLPKYATSPPTTPPKRAFRPPTLKSSFAASKTLPCFPILS